MSLLERMGLRSSSKGSGKQGEQGQSNERYSNEELDPQLKQDEVVPSMNYLEPSPKPVVQSPPAASASNSQRQMFGSGSGRSSLMEIDQMQSIDSVKQAASHAVIQSHDIIDTTTRQQRLYLLFNDFESSKLAILLSILSITVITVDILFLIIETDPSLHLPPNIWVRVNLGISAYFLLEYGLRVLAHNAFEETFKEFITRPYNLIDCLALTYSCIEILIHLCGGTMDDRVKILRMLIVLRMIRIFKYSTFSKGVKILIKGLSESIQALTILLFFTMICVILMSSFIYFVEKEFADERPSDIQNIPQAIWWAIITITTVGYGDLVPISFPGKIIGAFALVFGVLLLSLPVAIIGNKFQEIYLSNQKEETQSNREKTKKLYHTSENQDEKEIYRIILKLNELEEANETIEKCLQDNQFLYRSITRDAQNLIEKIESHKDKRGKKNKLSGSATSTSDRINHIREQIAQKRKQA